MPDTDDQRRFSDQELALILRRAVELEATSSPTTTPRQIRSLDGLTLAEIQEIAQEAGIDPDRIAQAAATIPSSSASALSRIAGGPSTFLLEHSVPGRVPNQDLQRVADAARAVLGNEGEAREVVGTLEWNTIDRLNSVRVTVAPQDDETRMRIAVERGGDQVLSGVVPTALGVFALAGISSTIDPQSAAGIIAAVGSCAGGAIALGRTLWVHRTKQWNQVLSRLMSALSSSAAEAAEPVDDVTEPEGPPIEPTGDEVSRLPTSETSIGDRA